MGCGIVKHQNMMIHAKPKTTVWVSARVREIRVGDWQESPVTSKEHEAVNGCSSSKSRRKASLFELTDADRATDEDTRSANGRVIIWRFGGQFY